MASNIKEQIQADLQQAKETGQLRTEQFEKLLSPQFLKLVLSLNKVLVNCVACERCCFCGNRKLPRKR